MKRIMPIVAVLFGAFAVRAVDLAGNDLTVTELDSAGYSNSGAAATLTIDLADDVTYAGTVGENVKVVKKGAGTLVLTSAWSSCPALTVEAGCVSSPTASYLCKRGGPVTLDGGALRFTSTFSWDSDNLAPTVTVKYGSEGTIDIPSGVTVTFLNMGYFIFYPHATLHLTGAGVAYLSGAASVSQCGDGILDARCGTLRHGQQFFCSASADATRTTMRVNEGVTMDVLDDRFMTWPKYTILQGATVVASGQAKNYTNAIGRLAKTYEGLTFGERVTVEPSSEPSRICVYEAALATKTAETVFDVKTGATLEIYSRIARGRATASTARTGQGFVKTGGGTLKIFETMNVDGLVHVTEGTLVLSRAAYLSCSSQLKCETGAVVRLNDGSLLVAAVRPNDALDPFLSTAQVWMDAARLPYADGTSLPTLQNLGRSGGYFHNFTKGTNAVPLTPVLQRNGINGRPCVLFQGNHGLVLDSYTNKSYKIHVFLAYRPTDITSTYRSSFPLTMCCANGGVTCGETFDNGTVGKMNGHVILAPQSDWRIIMADHGAKRYTVRWDSTGLAQDAPVVLEHLRDGIYEQQNVGGKIFYGTAGDTGFTTSSGYSVPQDIEQVSLGCRLRTDGSASHKFYGLVGEVLVFNEYLTGDQRTYVENYLRNKWLGASLSVPTLAGYAACAVTNLVVDVPSGRASLAPAASGSTPSVGNAAVKTGAGEIVYAGASPDVTKLSVAEGAVTFAGANGGSAAAVWVDAADAETVRTETGSDGVTRVMRIANKGSAGGVFAQNPHTGNTVTQPAACPAYATGSDGINGLGAISFDWHSALSTEAYTNSNADTCGLCVYCVCVRTGWEQVHASGPFSMTTLDTDSVDASAKHGLLWQDKTASQKWVVCDWVSGTPSYLESCAGNGTPLLFAFRCGAAGLQMAEYVADGADLKCNAGYMAVKDNQNRFDAPSIDFIQLGGRVWGRGVPLCPTDGSSGMNRMWKGKLGEFIVFDHRPSEDEEEQLCAYLAKKWFGIGSGSAEPPAFLAGRTAAPSFLAGTELALASGTSVTFDTTNAVAVGTLTAPGTVTVRETEPVKVNWRPFFSFDTFDGDVSKWTLLGSKRSLSRIGGEIGICAPGLMVIIR